MTQVVVERRIAASHQSHQDGFAVPYGNSQEVFGELVASAALVGWIRLEPFEEGEALALRAAVTVWQESDRDAIIRCQREALSQVSVHQIVWRFVIDENGGIDRVDYNDDGRQVLEKLSGVAATVLTAELRLANPKQFE